MTTPRKIILLYHRVASLSSDPWSLCVSPVHFEEHLQVLRKHTPVSVTELIDFGHGRRRDTDCLVGVTFDDGYADNFEEAAPLLARYETPASFFIATAYVDGSREFWWDELERFVSETPWQALATIFRDRIQNPSSCEKEARNALYFRLYDDLQPMSHEGRLALLNGWLEKTEQSAFVRESHRIMTRDRVLQLSMNDLFEIGSHTLTHPKLSAQAPSDQKREIGHSKSWLDALLRSTVVGFSYPYGAPHHYDEGTVKLVEDAGFSYAVTTAARPLKATDPRFRLPRFNVTDMSGTEFEHFLSRCVMQGNNKGPSGSFWRRT